MCDKKCQNDPIAPGNRKRPGGEVRLPPHRASSVSNLRFLQLADLVDKNKKPEPFANRLQVRISPIWKGRAKKVPTFGAAFGGAAARGTGGYTSYTVSVNYSV